MRTDTSRSRALNHLIEDCIDDGHAYRAAAAFPSRHRGELMSLSRRSSSFVATLSRVVRAMGRLPSRRGTVASWMRRGLFDVRVTLLGQTHLGDSLGACANQAHRSARGYDRALRSTWASDLEAILRSQLDEIRMAQSRILALRDRL